MTQSSQDEANFSEDTERTREYVSIFCETANSVLGRLAEKVFSRFETRQISPWQADQEVRQVSLDKARFRERAEFTRE